MLCREGKLSVYCFLGTIALVFSLSLLEHILQFSPKIWGSLLWGPLLYFAVVNITLRLMFDHKEYQVNWIETNRMPRAQLFMFCVFCTDRSTSFVLGFRVIIQCIVVLCGTIMLETVRCIWLYDGHIPLQRISGHRVDESRNVNRWLVHTESFDSVCCGCVFKLVWVRRGITLLAMDERTLCAYNMRNYFVYSWRTAPKTGHHHGTLEFQSYRSIYEVREPRAREAWSLWIHEASIVRWMVLVVNWNAGKCISLAFFPFEIYHDIFFFKDNIG